MSLAKKVLFVLRDIKMLSWMPNRLYLPLYYRVVTGRKLHLNKPVLFTEKLQWIKVYDHNPEYTIMSDKYLAKDYVSQKIGSQYIVPLLGVWDKPQDIPFDTLPDKFVLKTTHDSGGVVVIDKNQGYNKGKVMDFLQSHLDKDLYDKTREWTYKNIKHRIIAEEYISNNVETVDGAQREVLLDYKFYCFNGEPKFLYVGYSNMKNGQKHDQLTYYDFDWKKTAFYRSDHEQLPFIVNKPDKLCAMIEISRKLSQGIPFVRVDLFYVNGLIYFSELTFFPGSGFAPFEPLEWEKQIGDWIQLPIIAGKR